MGFDPGPGLLRSNPSATWSGSAARPCAGPATPCSAYGAARGRLRGRMGRDFWVISMGNLWKIHRKAMGKSMGNFP